MNTVDSSAAQIFDKLSDALVGPVRGTVSCTAATTIWVPQGQLATLADGRRVRVVKATSVGASRTAIPVRLEWLAPA